MEYICPEIIQKLACTHHKERLEVRTKQLGWDGWWWWFWLLVWLLVTGPGSHRSSIGVCLRMCMWERAKGGRGHEKKREINKNRHLVWLGRTSSSSHFNCWF